MGRFNHILIVSDVDGPFLDHTGKLVSRNLEALERFRAEGGRFTFASGRVHYNIDSILPDADRIANVPAIMANGAYLYDFAQKNAFAETFMEPTSTLEVMQMVKRDYPACGIRASTASGFLTDSLDGIIGQDVVRFAMRSVTVEPVSCWRAGDWYKVVLRGDSDDLDRMREDIETGWPGKFTLCKSNPEVLELLRYGCTKASVLDSLRAYCTQDGCAPIVYAVGDYENDLEMLRAADYAFCPTNAIPSVRAIASVCPASCDEGVIAALIESLERETVFTKSK